MGFSKTNDRTSLFELKFFIIFQYYYIRKEINFNRKLFCLIFIIFFNRKLLKNNFYLFFII